MGTTALRDGGRSDPRLHAVQRGGGLVPSLPGDAGPQGQRTGVCAVEPELCECGSGGVDTAGLAGHTSLTGVYSPATTLVGAIRAIDPSRNFEILHLSISGRPFTAQGTPAPWSCDTPLPWKVFDGRMVRALPGCRRGQRVGGASADPSIDQHPDNIILKLSLSRHGPADDDAV